MGRVSAWWSSLGFGKGEQLPEPDFADMGTAFGLDASFSCQDGDAPFAPGSDRDAADEPRAEAASRGLPRD